ncbi:MAG TPA: signal peptidase II [bacterium]|nr:signal peptidase II [bacterium]
MSDRGQKVFFIQHEFFLGISFLGLILLISDRIFKALALSEKIFWQKNYQLALSFDFFSTQNLFFYALVGVLVIGVIYYGAYSYRQKFLLATAGWLWLLMGALSNIFDRLKFGYVIDYLNFYFFYNNLADILIWLGFSLIIIGVWYHKK